MRLKFWMILFFFLGIQSALEENEVKMNSEANRKENKPIILADEQKNDSVKGSKLDNVTKQKRDLHSENKNQKQSKIPKKYTKRIKINKTIKKQHKLAQKSKKSIHHKSKKKIKKFSFKINAETLQQTSNKLKQERKNQREARKLKSSRFRNLLLSYKINPDVFHSLGSTSDKKIAKAVRLLKEQVQDIGPHLWVAENPKKKKYMKKASKKLKKLAKYQIKDFKHWYWESWQRIKDVWKAKGHYYLRDDKLNREEHEKLYQLFLIETSEKLKYLLPLLDVEHKVIDILGRRLADIDNQKYIKLAVKLMSKQLFKEYLKRYKAYRRRHRSDYVKDLQNLNRKYMADFKANEDFDKRVHDME